ncbi:hypothetical protein KZ843_09485 [Pseudomonas aeruginosa]|nr:hypothetical protein [Pseudomonas aeruginosa]MBW6123116.1 hypothetical protein [Pseudomonas aeruginosa]
MKYVFLALAALTILSGCDAWNDKGPGPLAKEVVSVAFGVKPGDVSVYVKFAPGDQQATVRAEAGALSCLVDASAVDDERSPRFGWLVTGLRCGESKCADGPVSNGLDGQPVICSKGKSVEERTIEVEKCSPESGKNCVGLDLEALRKAAESGELKVPSAKAQ